MNRTEEIVKLGLLKKSGKIKPEELKNHYIKCNTINDLDLTLKLYRIVSYKRIIESLKNKCLDMSNPSTWEDPDETYLLNNRRIDLTNGTTVSLDRIKKRLYCQCWSINEESEALWKIRSLKENGYRMVYFENCEPVKIKYSVEDGAVCFENYEMVRIKSSGDKLIKSLFDINNPLHSQSCFIGRVKYLNKEDINKSRENKVSECVICDGAMPMIESLFFKQNAYEYENEVRLVFLAPEHIDEDYCYEKKIWEKHHQFNIDINDVIEEITFHPKLDDDKCAEMKTELGKLGYNTKNINKSQIFTSDDRTLLF